jgi:FMN phosphatase YigB (HAD superfamily)
MTAGPKRLPPTAIIWDFGGVLFRWDPAAFRLSQAQIDACLAELTRQQLSDIEFAQAQIRRPHEIHLLRPPRVLPRGLDAHRHSALGQLLAREELREGVAAAVALNNLRAHAQRPQSAAAPR